MPLEHNLSHRYVLKSAIEQLLGKDAWHQLKETTSLTPWRQQILKLLKAIRISVHESVQVHDKAWILAIEENLTDGEGAARQSKDIDELLSCFAATLLRQVFLQLGGLPNRKTIANVTLKRENWRMNGLRSVQYVQSRAQIEAAFWNEQQSSIGFKKQLELLDEHRQSESKLPYSEWCRQRGSEA